MRDRPVPPLERDEADLGKRETEVLEPLFMPCHLIQNLHFAVPPSGFEPEFLP